MQTCPMCREFQSMFEAAVKKNIPTESLIKVAQEHVNEMEHPLSLMHFAVDKEEASKINVTSVFLQPPIKFITISFIVGPAEQKP